MATRRFVLYVESDEQKTLLAQWMKSQTHVQVLSTLGRLPPWLQQARKPLLVDLLTQEAAWGSELDVMMNSRRPPSKFSPVEDLD